MSEKVLAMLFRLYPTAFRERYLHEAQLLCRDRRRHERGIYLGVRLACDLFVDFLIGLTKAWRTSYSGVAASSRVPSAPLPPSFRLLQAEPLRPSSILLGGILSMTAILSFALVLRTAALHPRERHGPSPIDSVLQRVNQPTLPPPETSDPRRVTGHLLAPADTQRPGESKTRDLPKNQNPSPSALLAEAGKKPLATSLRSLQHAGGPSLTTQRGGARSALASVISATQDQRNTEGPVNPQDATRAMIQAISAHQIVMFGETHGNKQEYQWLCKLVKTPAFADRVDDIVVEFGNSLYQKTVDRYIAGEDIPQVQVERAWRNMIGAVGPVSPAYGWFYQAVRASNLERRDGHKIRVLLGDPYGDWEKIHNAEDLGPYLGHRDQWYAEVVKNEVLKHHHRALLIMGAGHFLRRNGPGLVEQAVRAAGVQPYLVVFGTNAVGGYDDLDHRFDAWPLPAIVALSGNWVGQLPANPVMTGGIVAPNSQKMESVADAMLYVGSRDTLTQVFMPRSKLVNTAYGKEIERRLQIQTGRTMEFAEASEGPQYQKPLEQTVSNGIHRLPPNPPKSINNPLPPRPPSQ